MVPQKVIHEFQKKFKHETEISKPEEANGLEKITIYRRADEEEQEAAALGKSIFSASTASTPKLALTPPPKLPPKGSFAVNNPLRATAKRKDSTYVPTLKSVESVAQSIAIPEIPDELTRSPTPPRGESPSS